MRVVIREAIKDVQEKEKLDILATITTVSEDRLIEIMNGAVMTSMEESTLKVHFANG